MATVTAIPQTPVSRTATGANSLANGTYVLLDTVDITAVDPVDEIVELKVTPGTVSGNYKQVQVYVKISLDGTNYSSGPESGTTTTDDPNLYTLGTVPCGTSSTAQTKAFSLRNALGFIPPKYKVIIFNNTGAALASSGNSLQTTSILGNIA
jgi:hypothetical protein